MSIPPTRNQYTQDVAERGMQAILEARQKQQYGPLTRNEGLQNYAAGGAAVDATASPEYQQWLNARKGPQDYQIAVGQTGGKYNGFQTEGQLRSAVSGTADTLRMQDRDRAAALEQMLGSRMSDVDKQYNDRKAQLAPIPQTIAPNGTPMYADRASSVAADAAGSTGRSVADSDTKAIDDWYKGEQGKLLKAKGLAQDIQQTPEREYASIAGERYGVDPALIAGWNPESGDIADFKSQRDLQSLHATGMPYSEYQQALGGIQSENDKATTEQAKADKTAADQEVDNSVLQATSWNAADLSNAANLPKEALPEIVGSQAYQSIAQQIDAAIAENTDEQGNIGQDQQKNVSKVVDEAINTAYQSDPTQGPALARILQAIYGDRLV